MRILSSSMGIAHHSQQHAEKVRQQQQQWTQQHAVTAAVPDNSSRIPVGSDVVLTQRSVGGCLLGAVANQQKRNKNKNQHLVAALMTSCCF
jgi:hypothetical protein